AGGPASRKAHARVQVVTEYLRTRRVAELRHRLALDLPDTFASDPVDLADLVQGLRLAVGEPETHGDHTGLTLGERVQDRVQLLLQEREADRLARLNGLGVLDEVTELAVAVLTQRGVQRNGFAAVLLDFDNLFGGHVEFLGQLLRERLSSQVLEHLALDTSKFVYDLDHVHRDTDGACLVGHRSGDGLADPPGGISGELETLGVVELLHRTDQPQVALLDQVQEQHAATGITLGQGHDQTQVGLEQVLLGAATVLGDPLQLVPEL